VPIPRPLAALALVVACAAPVRSQSYDASWWTVDGGGATLAGGPYGLTGTTGQPDAGGPFTGGSFGLGSGFWAVTAGGATPVQADVALTKSDSQDPVGAGHLLVYTLRVTNLGPGAAPAVTVTDPLPAGLGFVSAAPSVCSIAAGTVTCALGPLAAGASVSVDVTVAVGASVRGLVTNAASVAGGTADPVAANDADSEDTLVVLQARTEIAHGSQVRADLRSLGGFADEDLYRLRQEPYASYEVVVDEASGDVGLGTGPALERVGADGATVLQTSIAAGSGPARTLRFRNQTSASIDDQLVRVRSRSCASDCGPEDSYRLRVRETTLRVPRFNNAGTQQTVVLLQNATDAAVSGTVRAWAADGSPAGTRDFSLVPHGLAVVDTTAIAPGIGGSMTIDHDGPYGAVAGKAVSLEPATGFSFDSPIVARPR
jgi:uncharacterized repeat protein (TIGR01451 family)